MDILTKEFELTNSEGNKVRISVFAKFEDSGKEYVVANDCSDASKNYILQLVSNNEGDMLVSIDNEEEYERLSLVANKIMLSSIDR
jgi:hypothetical protein